MSRIQAMMITSECGASSDLAMGACMRSSLNNFPPNPLQFNSLFNKKLHVCSIHSLCAAQKHAASVNKTIVQHTQRSETPCSPYAWFRCCWLSLFATRSRWVNFVAGHRWRLLVALPFLEKLNDAFMAGNLDHMYINEPRWFVVRTVCMLSDEREGCIHVGRCLRSHINL